MSNPCVELWGLLLHRDQAAEIDRFQAQSQLAKLPPKVHHKRNPVFDLATVLAAIDAGDTHQRAKKLIVANQSHSDCFENPTTRFHLLVARLRELAS